jgi:hypothetical protein
MCPLMPPQFLGMSWVLIMAADVAGAAKRGGVADKEGRQLFKCGGFGIMPPSGCQRRKRSETL